MLVCCVRFHAQQHQGNLPRLDIQLRVPSCSSPWLHEARVTVSCRHPGHKLRHRCCVDAVGHKGCVRRVGVSQIAGVLGWELMRLAIVTGGC